MTRSPVPGGSLPILIMSEPGAGSETPDLPGESGGIDPFRRELARLYADLDAELARHRPRCDASGRCCRFEEYGHTLFLSRAEAEWLFEPGLPSGTDLDPAGCPWQVNNLCTARERRPIGCRVYFCDPDFADRMGPVSEVFVARLKGLHERFERAWDYRPLHRFGDLVRDFRPESAGQFPPPPGSGTDPPDLT